MPQAPLSQLQTVDLTQARGRLRDRGIDPDHVLGEARAGQPFCVAGLYCALGAIAASEKAGQNPTYAMARLALRADLPSEIAETLYLAYNQQSAEEAGHGDKVFGNAYFTLGGVAATADLSVVGNGDTGSMLVPGDDLKQNRKQLSIFAAVLGGIETVALQLEFPRLVALCETWDHPVARDLLLQIRDTVRPEESRHVLLFRYVFHQIVASKGSNVIAAFLDAMNTGRTQLGAEALAADSFMRLVGSQSPTPRQLLGKDRTAWRRWRAAGFGHSQY
jgi:hypothetical protein